MPIPYCKEDCARVCRGGRKVDSAFVSVLTWWWQAAVGWTARARPVVKIFGLLQSVSHTSGLSQAGLLSPEKRGSHAAVPTKCLLRYSLHCMKGSRNVSIGSGHARSVGPFQSLFKMTWLNRLCADQDRAIRSRPTNPLVFTGAWSLNTARFAEIFNVLLCMSIVIPYLLSVHRKIARKRAVTCCVLVLALLPSDRWLRPLARPADEDAVAPA